MANIFDKAKSAIRKISDDVNKDKWDRNCINSALFTDPEPGKHVPPARQEGVPAPVPAGGSADPARNTMQRPGGNAIQTGNSNGGSIVAPAPEVAHSGEKPSIKPGMVNGEQENKPVRFINPRFNRSINYVTSKVVMPGANNVRSLSELPTVDPSQSISHIGDDPSGAAASAAAPQPMAAAPQAASAPEAVPQAAPQPMAAAPQAASAPEAVPQAAPQPMAAAPQAASAPVAVPQAAPQPMAAAPQAAPAPEAVPQAAPAPAAPEAVPQAAPQPVPVVVAPSVTVAAVQTEPVSAEAPEVAAQPAPAAAEAAAPVEVTVEEKCYYVLIKHTKTFPAPGSRVLMRNCDSQYAWTDEQSESERPTYKVCPNCGKPIDIIETEMD